VGDVSPLHRGHRCPVVGISQAVWLYQRFPLLREIEELMLDRGVIVSYETIRRWCAQFGQTYDDALRRRQPGPGDKWHLDEVFLKVDRRSAGACGGPGTGRSGVVRLMRVRGED
jgi:putative transposase